MSATPPGPAAAVISAEIARGGPIPFREFMDLALYAPGVGYYQRAEPRLGPEGDFYTSPDLHPAFGACLGRQLAELWRHLGEPARFDLVELGGGKGLLARDVLTWADTEAPAFAAALAYTSVELSDAMRDRQRALLTAGDFGRRWRDRLTWLDRLDAAPTAFTGCVLAHEFFDALPVHRLVADGAAWREVYVVIDAGPEPHFAERVGPLSTPRLAAWLAASAPSPRSGRRLEVNLAALDWVTRLAPLLQRGYLLAVDYGLTTAEFDAPERQAGTLRAYRHHTVAADPYAEPGAWDLTCQVDFSALTRAGVAAGFAVAGFTRQSHCLAALGLGDYLVRRLDDPATSLTDYRTDRRAIEALVHPRGLGAFRVLALAKGVADAPLLGFTLLDERPNLGTLA